MCKRYQANMARSRKLPLLWNLQLCSLSGGLCLRFEESVSFEKGRVCKHQIRKVICFVK